MSSASEIPRITKFTNGYLLRHGTLVQGDLWIDASTGTVISPQSAFYSQHTIPDRIVDLQGKILSPGFLDVQLNGAHGFDFSVPCEHYAEGLQEMARKLIKSGVTSYLPTITSQLPGVYKANLPHLGPSATRSAQAGSESLGAHVEGPFLSPAKNGIHTPSVLRTADSFSDLESCYGAEYLNNGTIAKLTAAPELGAMLSLIPELTSRGIVYSIGHSDADFAQAQAAVAAGATMVTHMFNAMRPFGHRDPGIFGLLGQNTPSQPSTPKNSAPPSPRSAHTPSPSPHRSRRSTPRSSLSISSTPSSPTLPPQSYTPTQGHKSANTTKPYFGLIADLIHLSAPTLAIAHHAHPTGSILVTDAMPLAGLPDGTYSWTNDEKIIKSGPLLTLEKNGRIAGSAVTLIECVNNFKRALGEGVSWGEVLGGVTERPAAMLSLDNRKGGLRSGMDADLCVLERVAGEGGEELRVEGVWKFGVQVV